MKKEINSNGNTYTCIEINENNNIVVFKEEVEKLIEEIGSIIERKIGHSTSLVDKVSFAIKANFPTFYPIDSVDQAVFIIKNYEPENVDDLKDPKFKLWSEANKYLRDCIKDDKIIILDANEEHYKGDEKNCGEHE